MNLAHLLARSARVFATQPAVIYGTQPHADYGSLASRVARLARWLRAHGGAQAGDRVVLLMKNCPQYLEVMYGVWWAGLVAVPVNAKLHPQEVRFILDNSGARLVFATPDWAGAIGGALQGMDAQPVVIDTATAAYAALFAGEPAPVSEVAGGDLAWLFYTSGTTGRPKGAMLSHANLLRMTQGYFTDVDSIAPGDCIVHAAPMSHGSGLYNFAHVLAGASNVIPESGGFEPDEILSLLKQHRGMTLFAAPTMVRRLVDRAEDSSPDLANLKTIVYGGGPMYLADIQRALTAMGPRFAQIYGQGESPMTISALSKFHINDAAHPRHGERLASVGVPQSAVQVRVCDEIGREFQQGEVGEVCVKGDVVMSGYWHNPEATAKALRGGWLWTGDLGAFDQDGFLTLKDRSRDLIISGGSNIYPREVEEVLLLHAGVAEASVVGRPHPEWGEEVVAFVVAKHDAAITPQELDQLCLDHIARFKRPKEYRFVDALPKNNYGKVLKTELRGWLAPHPEQRH